MLPTLYLHIGTPKSGTTSVQDFVHHNRTILKTDFHLWAPECMVFKRNWELACYSAYPENSDYYLNTLHCFSRSELEAHCLGYPQKFGRIISEIEGDEPNASVFASSEYLYSQCESDTHLVRLHSLLSRHFRRIELIFTFRDQKAYIRSAYAQLVKGPRAYTESFDIFLASVNTKSRYDYQYRLDMWRAAFPDSPVHKIQVGKGHVNGSELQKALLSIVTANKNRHSLDKLRFPQRVSNRSPAYNNLRLMRYINRIVGNRFRVSRLLRKALIKSLGAIPLGGHYPTAKLDQVTHQLSSPGSG